MNKEQRKQWLRKLNEMPVAVINHGPSSSYSIVTTDDSTELPTTADPSLKVTVQHCSQSVSQPAQAAMLSTNLSSFSSNLDLPPAAIGGIAKKAAEICVLTE